jgi:predicted small integral membrane protein
VWGAVGGFGAAAGVLLGGVLTSVLSWSWIFFVNIPVAVAGFILAPILLKESRDASVKSFDAGGAVLVTSGLSLFVYAITEAGRNGWVAGSTIAFFAVAVALLVGFVVWELRHPEPLMRIGILRIKTVTGANVAGFILGTATFSLFLMLTLYMQQVLGYSPIKTGVAYLAVAGTAIFTSCTSPRRRCTARTSSTCCPGSCWSPSASASRSCRSRSPHWRASSRPRRAWHRV